MSMSDFIKHVADGNNFVEAYSCTFGVGDVDILEAPWLERWVERNKNHLEYDVYTCRWFWRD